ncbi:hypothetical protein Poli38472_013538 [Pythium oligandrum]|uniref:DUF4246 domain-containing protein n=1 Tax=Pythium oligandrum TaxID=41045 RepID=A0A8K1FEL3_PYTOL|nr:hypothetical protein Poli38472_013538 [Pythium oligandrum]|eukprot:TMW58064.1 hypothetical protein Poli38472_013538 [Pythium oligandrum]
MEPFGQLLVYFVIAEMNRCLKDRPLEDWPLDTVTLDWKKSRKMAQKLLMALRSRRLKESSFCSWLCSWFPNADPRPEVTRALWFYVRRALKELTAIRNCIINTLDAVIRDEMLTVTSTGEGFISSGPVQETWMSDSLIPLELKTAFLSQVELLKKDPDSEEDWHPGRWKNVLDVVHPSLYCCVLM